MCTERLKNIRKYTYFQDVEDDKIRIIEKRKIARNVKLYIKLKVIIQSQKIKIINSFYVKKDRFHPFNLSQITVFRIIKYT